MKKFKEYLHRYGLSELWATGVVMLCALVIYRAKGSMTSAILSATIVDPLVFFTVSFVRNRKHEKSWHNGISRLTVEHAAAGIFNAVFVRPVLLAVFILHFNILAGTALGKFCSDLIFFVLSAPMHELSKKIIPKKSGKN